MVKTPDEIKKALECCSGDGNCKKCGYEHDCNMYEGFSILAKDALKYIRQIEAKQSKWISVDERLPLHDQDVLVLTAPGTLSLGQNMLVATYIHPRNEQYGVFINFYAGYDDKNILTVTHWMPLPSMPEPPKEVQQ